MTTDHSTLVKILMIVGHHISGTDGKRVIFGNPGERREKAERLAEEMMRYEEHGAWTQLKGLDVEIPTVLLI